MVGKKNTLIRLVAFALSFVLMFSAVGFTSSAYKNEGGAETIAGTEEKQTRSAKTNLTVKGISNTRVGAYPKTAISRNGKATGMSAISVNGTYYIALREFITKMTNMKLSYSAAAKTLTVSGSGLYMTATDGAYVIYANGRALFDMTPSRIMSDGRMYVPAGSLAKALGLRLSVGAGIDFSGNVKPLQSADEFYDGDSVLWLARIIHAESRGEPLLGQIAVGNVIMNRVKSSAFPNTIWGVIFDKKYGVQFSPVANGTIYNTPAYSPRLAAMIVLEGFTVSKDIIYFLAPRYAESSWIINSRRYTFTIQNHEFYA